ncbi:MAG: aspartate-semialdehyde dehydrogenase [Actinobacteria bacterium]|nr:aspartate-semialdehyde dehydrogenase [Actinomycetota bacterium]
MALGEGMRVTVVGATGLVGRELLRLLQVRRFPVAGDPVLVASPASEGRRLPWMDREVRVRALSAEVFDGVDVALFSAGGPRSREFAPVAVEAGAVVVDNSSAWRSDPDVPLVVAEVNPQAIARRPKRIVANPNCTTMVLMVAAGPLHAAFGLVEMTVATYQSVGGEGRAAIGELVGQARKLVADADRLRRDGAAVESQVVGEHFSRTVAFNVLAHCGDFQGDHYTVEEHKGSR